MSAYTWSPARKRASGQRSWPPSIIRWANATRASAPTFLRFAWSIGAERRHDPNDSRNDSSWLNVRITLGGNPVPASGQTWWSSRCTVYSCSLPVSRPSRLTRAKWWSCTVQVGSVRVSAPATRTSTVQGRSVSTQTVARVVST